MPLPAPVTLGQLWVVSAPSGAGKTSLTRALLPRLNGQGHAVTISVSSTTRAPRLGEVEGVHYHFLSDEAFVQDIENGCFLEHAQVFGRRYGTSKQAVQSQLQQGTDVILDIDWQGHRQVVQHLQAHSVFILPPSLQALEQRLRGRGQDSEDTIQARMREAQSETAHWHEYQHVLVNDDFETALAQLEALFIAARLHRDVQQHQQAGLLAELLAV
jgi:guanylate kinase